MNAFDFISNEKRRTEWLALLYQDDKKSLVLLGIINRAGDSDSGCFIKTILLIVKRRRTQMQRTGHPEAEVARFALGIVSFVITDVADPGRSFHVVVAAHICALKLDS